jgi:hypothetical protein
MRNGALADIDPSVAAVELERALSGEEAGGLPTLSAACCVNSARLAERLRAWRASRHPHLAFCGRGRAHRTVGISAANTLASLAPKIKEPSHRALRRHLRAAPVTPLPQAIAPALAVLRDAERHLDAGWSRRDRRPSRRSKAARRGS